MQNNGDFDYYDSNPHQPFFDILKAVAYPYVYKRASSHMQDEACSPLSLYDVSSWVMRREDVARLRSRAGHLGIILNEGFTSNKTHFITTPVGLIYTVSHDEHRLMQSSVVNIQGTNFLNTRWLLGSYAKKQFLQRPAGDLMEKLLNFSETARAARKREQEEARAAQAKRWSDQRASVIDGRELTKEQSELIDDVMSFDVTYDYSDDHKYCIRYREYEKTLRATLNESGLGEKTLDKRVAIYWEKTPNAPK